MKQLKKKKVLQLAIDSGLVYNTHLQGFEIFPHHAKAIYDFYLLIEKELKSSDSKTEDAEIRDIPE